MNEPKYNTLRRIGIILAITAVVILIGIALQASTPVKSFEHKTFEIAEKLGSDSVIVYEGSGLVKSTIHLMIEDGQNISAMKYGDVDVIVVGE